MRDDRHRTNAPPKSRRAEPPAKRAGTKRLRFGVPGRVNRKMNNGGILAGVMLFFLLIYIGGFVYTYISKEKIVEGQIVYGSIEDPSITDAIIVRDEKVYNSPISGSVSYTVNNGEKVRNGAVVCNISDREKTKAIEDNLTAINTSILKMQENTDYFFKDDIVKANGVIERICEDAAFSFVGMNMDKLYITKDKIQENLNFRNQMLLSVEMGGAQSFIQEKNIYENQLNSLLSPIAVEESGIVSYILDGMEGVVTKDMISSIPEEYIPKEREERLLTSVKDAESGKGVFKLILSNEWYICAYMNPSVTKDWQEGDTLTIYIEEEYGYKPLEVKVSQLTGYETKTYVVFSCNKFVTEYESTRFLTFRITKGAEKGLQIPNSAISEKTLLIIPREYFIKSEDGSFSVIKQTSEGKEEIFVNVNDSDDVNRYVISDYFTLKVGDVLFPNSADKDIYTIKSVENVAGIYITNTGTAVFKRINLEGAQVASPDYTILDIAKNTSLKVHDKIAMDVKNVYEGQLVY